MIHVGIDPGQKGAVAAIDGAGRAQAWRIPVVGKGYDLVGMVSILAGLNRERRVVLVAIEEVTSSPTMGVVSAFSFGRGFGTWEGMVAALGLRLRLVRPKVWQGGLGLPKDANERKAALARLAAQRWPEVQIRSKADWGKADALWIAHWAATQAATPGRAEDQPTSEPPEFSRSATALPGASTALSLERPQE